MVYIDATRLLDHPFSGPPGQFVSGSTSSLDAIFAQFVDFFAAHDNLKG
ncbi:MAG: hypothetical protein H6641_21230 [Caldilineaceae bacterium]|nr:hypothetical protein [Caldilineaceae bacterium]